jgi:hypothetical protein
MPIALSLDTVEPPDYTYGIFTVPSLADYYTFLGLPTPSLGIGQAISVAMKVSNRYGYDSSDPSNGETFDWVAVWRAFQENNMPPEFRSTPVGSRDLLAQHGLVERRPPVRSSDFRSLGSPFHYYLTRKLGLVPALRYSVALSQGTWFHAALELLMNPSNTVEIRTHPVPSQA